MHHDSVSRSRRRPDSLMFGSLTIFVRYPKYIKKIRNDEKKKEKKRSNYLYRIKERKVGVVDLGVSLERLWVLFKQVWHLRYRGRAIFRFLPLARRITFVPLYIHLYILSLFRCAKNSGDERKLV